MAKHWWLVLRCSLLGTALGAIPGVGSAVIDWIAYGHAQRSERNAETFGSGDVRGVIAPESSNNAKEGGHLVPTIAFGVPAGASMAVLLGAFLMHGLQPGPDMLTKHLDLTYTIVWSLTLAHVIGALICLSGSRWLAQISRIRPEILLPIVLAFVFVAAFQGSHDWGDLYILLLFGIIGWFMKDFGWPRPPLVLGLVIGSLFERYLFISTELYGLGWVLRPVVLVILAIVAWCLYRPLSKLALDVIAQLRTVGVRRFRLTPPAAFTLTIIALIVAAIISALDWPTPAKLVPLTACVIALVTTTLNLVYEVLGPEPAATKRPLGATSRVIAYFAWLVLLLALIALIGFIPAIGVFIFSYMRWGFRESWIGSLGYAAATSLVCWLVFDLALHAAWPHSWLGDLLPSLSAGSGLI